MTNADRLARLSDIYDCSLPTSTQLLFNFFKHKKQSDKL